MVEAVSVASSNAPIVRSNAEQADVVRAAAPSPAKVEASASLPQAPYVSPYIYVDQNFHKAVTQIRDSSTGRVIGQFPTEQTLNLRHAQAEHQSTDQATTSHPAPVVTTATPVAAPAISTAVVAPQQANSAPQPVQAQAASDALTTVANGGGAQSKTVNITA